MILGQRIKEEREKRNWTQTDLTEKLNVSRQSISKWELDSAYPDIERLIQISDLFNVTLDSLIKGDSELQRHITVKGTDDHMNGWEFWAHYWWIIFPIAGLIMSFLSYLN
ncbi:helix-turn-helix domain-containing protein [Companilactobacillus kimchiensis]|nr:helix-turn-helix transcriptional regulator [Companilactobacillus kimchiensis]